MRLGFINPGEWSDGLQRKGSNPLSTTNYIRVAQLDRATVYETVGWGLVSLRGYHFKGEQDETCCV